MSDTESPQSKRRKIRARSKNEGEVLLIEPEEALRHEYRAYLNEAGYKVLEFEDSEQFFEFLDSRPWSWRPWTTILEIIVPGTGGFEIVRRLRDRYRDQSGKILFVSRLYSSDDISEAELAGADCYLSKPVRKEKLLSTIRQMFERASDTVVFSHSRGDKLES